MQNMKGIPLNTVSITFFILALYGREKTKDYITLLRSFKFSLWLQCTHFRQDTL